MTESGGASWLRLPFTARTTECAVEVAVEPNRDPTAVGCPMLDPTLPVDAALGYPICRAEIRTELDGYAAAFGWIQVVRSTDADNPGQFDIDPLALFRDVAMPFAFFGIKPMLFDAPFRERRYDMGWEAHAFLCEVPDGVMSHQVTPLVGFAWGFDVAAGQMRIHPARPLALREWNGHLNLLGSRYPDWGFARAE